MKKKMNEDFVYCKVEGSLISVICHKESQQQRVIENLTSPGNVVFVGYEVWEDETTILTFRVLDYEELKPTKN